MDSFQILVEVFVAFWLVGSALAVGMMISRRNKHEASTWLSYIWAVLFSWVFVGWLAGEFAALAYKAASDIQSAMISSIQKQA